MDKFITQFTNPYYLFKQFCDKLFKCSTHQDALSLLDFIQILITIVDENKLFDLGIDSSELHDDPECVKKSLRYFFDRDRGDWHLALNRFASTLPSSKSKSDQLLFSSSFQTIARMLELQSKLYEENTNFYDSLNYSKQFGRDNANERQLVLASAVERRVDEVDSILLIDKWLCSMIYKPSSTLVLMFKQFLLNYETDELRIK